MSRSLPCGMLELGSLLPGDRDPTSPPLSRQVCLTLSRACAALFACSGVKGARGRVEVHLTNDLPVDVTGLGMQAASAGRVRRGAARALSHATACEEGGNETCHELLLLLLPPLPLLPLLQGSWLSTSFLLVPRGRRRSYRCTAPTTPVSRGRQRPGLARQPGSRRAPRCGPCARGRPGCW